MAQGVKGSYLPTKSSLFEQRVLEAVRETRKLSAEQILKAIGYPHSYRFSIQEILISHEIDYSGKSTKNTPFSSEYVPPVWLANHDGASQALQRVDSNQEYNAVKNKVAHAALQGKITVKQIVSATNHSRDEVEEVLILEDGLGIEIQRRKRDPVVDSYIARGMTCEEIATQPDVRANTKQGIHLYVSRTGQKALYDKKKGEKEKVKDWRQRRSQLLTEMASELERIAYTEYGKLFGAVTLAHKAHEYVTKYKSNLVSFQDVFQILRLNEAGFSPSEINEVLSLPENRKVEMYRILRKLGVDANLVYNVKKSRARKSDEVTEAAKRAYGLMNATDAAYFLGTSTTFVRSTWERQAYPAIQGPNSGWKFDSAIYEAVDAGLGVDDALEMLGVQELPRCVKNAKASLNARGEREPRIVAALRYMLPNRDITVSYFNSNILGS